MFAISLSRKTVLWLCLLFALSHADKDCDKSQCRGPVKYYEELRCKPVYAKPDDCCPVRYDCSHLEGRAANKCYVNGREYSIGDQLRDEDRANPCDVGCRCVKESNDVASFSCAVLDCFNTKVKDGCYLKRKPEDCCASEEICPKEGEEKVTCRVNGQIYHEGQNFQPEEKRDLTCTCTEGFTGEFIEPFCKKVSCGTEVQRSSEIYNKCVPVYYRTQSLTTSCNFSFRCQNDEDKIINAVGAIKKRAPDENKTVESVYDALPYDMKCTFGNITMNIGDELNEAPDYKCVRCVCEIPPVPTCLQLNYCPTE